MVNVLAKACPVLHLRDATKKKLLFSLVDINLELFYVKASYKLVL